MRKRISMICLLLTFIAAQAQTIHWLTFIDTKDERVGQIDVLSRKVLYSHFVNEVNAALAPKGYQSDIHDFYGDQITPENCKAAIQLLRVNDPNDIIVFYYIGHGGRPTTDTRYMMEHPYPQMCLAQHDEKKFIPLEWVYKQLSSKGARLSVTIGMCCNNLSNISIKDGPMFSPNYGTTYMSGNKLSRIQDLFLNVKGNVLSTSASPTQTSGCFKSDFGVIDRYTTVLCDIFNSVLDNYDKTLTWDDLLDALSEIIDKNTNGDQTPIHETHLAVVPPPETQKPVAPTQQQVQQTQQKQTPNATKTQGNGDEWVNALTNHLGTLINVNVAEYDRIELEKKLNGLFANNAQVRILAQDSDTAIDREDAATFLGRLATSRLLLKVAIVEGKFDSNNKITSLKVRELYKK